MHRSLKVLGGATLLLIATVGVLALVVARTNACPSITTTADTADSSSTTGMLAVRRHCYGGPDVLRLEQIARPTPSPNELLVEVHVAAVNPLDWHFLRGEPYVMRFLTGLGAPTDTSFGADFAGVVTAIGDSVTMYAVGDSVFGSHSGAYAEYLTVRESGSVAHMPSDVSFEQAAALPVAASTALQALRDQAHVVRGERVLINGASGGVGTFAVQIAKSFGAHVTGVASTRNMELVQSLGADATVDYTQTNFTRDSARYDVIIDMVGNHEAWALRRALVPGGRAVLVGAPDHDRFLGPLRGMLGTTIYTWFVKEQFLGLFASINVEDLTTLGTMMASGGLHAVIDRRYSLRESADAVAYQQAGRSRGKNLVIVR